ncbi:MAG: hypothetical protein M0Z39_00795 [Actinomycetota bacterium]|jgi:hypothetical protein|nr:hypothetical protein [Actinomycetota bacterium]
MNAIIKNEFASVEITIDEAACNQMLKIRDLRSGSEVELDALELEAFTRTSHRQFETFVDPDRLKESAYQPVRSK